LSNPCPLQLLGFPLSHINASDMKSTSHDIVMANFGDAVQHFYNTLDDQVVQDTGCSVHGNHCMSQSGRDNPGLLHPMLGVIGTPCQPFSRQRTKRSAEGSVAGHSKFPTTFKDLLAWLETYEPQCGTCEQVEGFTQAESPSVPESPMDRPGLSAM